LADVALCRGWGIVRTLPADAVETEQKVRIAILPNIYSILTSASKR
jgi:hypothetical protein